VTGDQEAEPSARRMAKRARAMVATRYGWRQIGDQVAAAYATAQREGPEYAAALAAERSRGQRVAPVVPTGNLLAD